MNKKILFSSLASIALLGSIVAGGTYALFTSEATTNISATSATVKYESSLVSDSIKLYSSWNDEALLTNNFTSGGTISVDEATNTITLDNIVPLDKVEFEIKINNRSTVKSQYAISYIAEGDLGSCFDVNIEQEAGWKTLEKGISPTENTKISIMLPENVGDEYQGKSGSVKINVYGLQYGISCPHDICCDYVLETPGPSMYNLKINCHICNEIFDLTQRQIDNLEGKYFIKKCTNADQTGNYVLSDKPLKEELNSDSIYSDSRVYLVLIKGYYSLKGITGRGPTDFGTVLDANLYIDGIYDYSSNNASYLYGETSLYWITVKAYISNVIFCGNSIYSSVFSITWFKWYINDCLLEGSHNFRGGERLTDCVIDSKGILNSEGENEYAIRIRSDKISTPEFQNCHFKTSGRAIYVDSYLAPGATKEGFRIDHCTFEVVEEYTHYASNNIIEYAIVFNNSYNEIHHYLHLDENCKGASSFGSHTGIYRKIFTEYDNVTVHQSNGETSYGPAGCIDSSTIG